MKFVDSSKVQGMFSTGCKRRGKFLIKIISTISQNDENYKNISSSLYFSILKEPMLVQKQTIHQQKALDLSFNLTP